MLRGGGDFDSIKYKKIIQTKRMSHVRPMSLYQQFVIVKAISMARNLPISLLLKVSSILLIT